MVEAIAEWSNFIAEWPNELEVGMTAKQLNPEAPAEEATYMWLGYGSHRVDPAFQIDAGMIRSPETFDVLQQLTGFDAPAVEPASAPDVGRAKAVVATVKKVAAVALMFLLFFAGAGLVAWLYVYLSQLFR